MPNSICLCTLPKLDIGEISMNTKVWDKLGICGSSLCLVHCLATPFVLLLFPTFEWAFLEHHTFHEILGVFVVSSVLIAVYPQCRKHGHKDIIGFALGGITFILAGIFLGHDLGDGFEQGFTIFGSILLVTAHFKNIKVKHGNCDTRTQCDSHPHETNKF